VSVDRYDTHTCVPWRADSQPVLCDVNVSSVERVNMSVWLKLMFLLDRGPRSTKCAAHHWH